MYQPTPMTLLIFLQHHPATARISARTHTRSHVHMIWLLKLPCTASLIRLIRMTRR